MTLKEILTLEEDKPCPGCPVCEPRLPGSRNRRLRQSPRQQLRGSHGATPRAGPGADHRNDSYPR